MGAFDGTDWSGVHVDDSRMKGGDGVELASRRPLDIRVPGPGRPGWPSGSTCPCGIVRSGARLGSGRLSTPQYIAGTFKRLLTILGQERCAKNEAHHDGHSVLRGIGTIRGHRRPAVEDVCGDIARPNSRSSSEGKATRSCRRRPNLSTLQAMTTSNSRRVAARHSASKAGRLSRPLAPLMPWSL
jgi:hypothetical protein